MELLFITLGAFIVLQIAFNIVMAISFKKIGEKLDDVQKQQEDMSYM